MAPLFDAGRVRPIAAPVEMLSLQLADPPSGDRRQSCEVLSLPQEGRRSVSRWGMSSKGMGKKCGPKRREAIAGWGCCPCLERVPVVMGQAPWVSSGRGRRESEITRQGSGMGFRGEPGVWLGFFEPRRSPFRLVQGDPDTHVPKGGSGLRREG